METLAWFIVGLLLGIFVGGAIFAATDNIEDIYLQESKKDKESK